MARYDAVSRCFVAAGRCRGYLKAQLRLSNAGAKWFQLVCGVGNYVYQLQYVSQNKDRMMPIQEAEFGDSLMQVGKGVTFNSSFSGELVCFANDANGLYFNNVVRLNRLTHSLTHTHTHTLRQPGSQLVSGRRPAAGTINRSLNLFPFFLFFLSSFLSNISRCDQI